MGRSDGSVHNDRSFRTAYCRAIVRWLKTQLFVPCYCCSCYSPWGVLFPSDGGIGLRDSRRLKSLKIPRMYTVPTRSAPCRLLADLSSFYSTRPRPPEFAAVFAFTPLHSSPSFVICACRSLLNVRWLLLFWLVLLVVCSSMWRRNVAWCTN